MIPYPYPSFDNMYHIDMLFILLPSIHHSHLFYVTLRRYCT